jgi:NADH:ubiquinone oxidoreductase subunit 4 (subunit M)
MLRAVRNILHGPLAENMENVQDANLWRKTPFLLLLASLLLFGVAPRLLTAKIDPAAREIVAMTKSDVIAAQARAEAK